MSQRRHTIRTTILFQHTFLTTNALLKTEDEECSALAKQITMLSDLKKDFITDCFINLAKFDFRIQFLQWFKSTKLDKYDVEKNEEIAEGIAQSQEMIDKLVGFIRDTSAYNNELVGMIGKKRQMVQQEVPVKKGKEGGKKGASRATSQPKGASLTDTTKVII